MASILLGGLANLFGGAGAASAAGAGVAAGATTEIAGLGAIGASGLSLSSILQGTATVLGVVSSIGAGNAEATQAELAADDAEAEVPLENLQGIQRRSSLKRQLADAIGAENVAYAASGVDLSVGTAASARKDAFREADTALTSDAGTQETRISRLAERAANYRAMAKQSRRMGLLNGIIGGAQGFASIFGRG